MGAGIGWAPAEADVYPCFSQRGKTVPEELVKPEELSKYRQVASHVVSAGMGKTPTWSWESPLDSLLGEFCCLWH